MTFPSELHESPLTAGSDFIKREEGSSTPITPPQAYTEFLKALTPVFTSPVSAGVDFPKFKFEKRRPSPISVPSSATSTVFSTRDNLSARDSPKVASATLPPTLPRPEPTIGQAPYNSTTSTNSTHMHVFARYGFTGKCTHNTISIFPLRLEDPVYRDTEECEREVC
ncbi:hypothetical protein N7505_010397 [Penicillium chrysogenum]|uniref:Uncharacterized protein n=1 Tax=Penicillium chrysogenum TaxID=5076 RepID=A0ABQ8W3I1_PENCH|nr:hypothetical protein N7505_010397 [Penicillium chrysogenum]